MEDKILIFTATYNESENITNFLKSVDKLNLNVDLLIIDDNSPDKTWEKVQNYSKDKKNIHLIIRDKKEGLDTAHKRAYEYSVNNGYKLLITLDADLTHDPNDIPRFIEELKKNTFVIGSRYMPGGKTDIKGWRFFLSYFGNRFFRFIFKINCSEYTSSFRGFNLNLLKDFDLKSVNSKGYSFFMESIFRINDNKIFIKEIPIYARQRGKGKSKIAKIEIFRTILNVLRLKLKIKN